MFTKPSSKIMRLKLLFLLLFFQATFALLLVRLFDVQIFKGENFFNLAENNRYFTKKNVAERAIFLDRYGQPLLSNEKIYFKYLNQDSFYSDKEFLDKDEALRLLASDSASVGYEFKRNYPHKEALASILGYLSPVTADDLAKNPNLALNSRLGRMGLEQFFDQNLRSIGSVSKFEVNALGQRQRLVSLEAAQYGDNISTSLDPYLSVLAYQAMAGKKGAVVIMDAKNGEILSLLSSPSFDPNVFEDNWLESLYNRERLSSTKIQAYLQDENQVFFNRSISGAYPPGSVFKLVTATAALQEGAIEENTTVDDQGTLKVGDFEYANWYFTQYGRTEGVVDVKKALARSNDIFFYKAAEWLGPNKLAEYARLFGFGSPTGLQLGQELAGLVPDPKWKEFTRGENWYLGNTYHFGIGQGDLLVTPIQVASMTQALANHGQLCQSSLLPTVKQNCRDLGIEDQYLEIVLQGMIAACSQGGTAYPLFPHNAQILVNLDPSLAASEQISQGMIACKTGTAEFGAADERGYRKTHAWTTAIVGIDKEKISPVEGEENILKSNWQKLIKKQGFPDKLIITVLVESDGEKIYSEGSQDAAPVIASIIKGIF